ncbi:MAG: selenocysteine-specific translation elongation factor [Deltaproteobacteria bacterium]|nr:selenocysteine-specific translation elongation factor [Deltaproteobacteria bacterium]
MPPRHAIVIGTAGHIDHGKTALTRALTGIDTDRLKEEKARGITIELGFAWLDLDGYRCGVVDVPGHERFVRTMVAGATGIDLVILVIAADEGVMPQTREHLDICRLLRVPRGVVALTKADLCASDWLELVREDVRATLRGTFLEAAPIVPCSAVTGVGLDALRAALGELAAQIPGRDEDGLARLPIDRVFTMHGFGTVATGTLVAGRLGVDDEVEALPGGARGKVRGLQVHGVATPVARAGQRTAVNLGGVPRDAIARGETLTHAGVLRPSSLIEAEVELLAAARAPLGRRTRLLCHAGTAQVPCLVVLLDGEEVPPGGTALVQLHLGHPLAALPGDRFILRGFTPQEHYGTTVGGGRVLRVLASRLRRRDPEAIARLQRLATADLPTRVAVTVAAAGLAGLTRAEVQQRLGDAPRAVDATLQQLLTARTLVRFDAERGAVAHQHAVAALEAAALEAVRAFHQAQPRQPGIGREELRTKLPPQAPARLIHVVVEILRARGALAAERDLLRLPEHVVDAAAPGASLRQQIAALYAGARLQPPRHAEVAALLQAVAPPGAARAAPSAAEVREALELLAREGTLVRVIPELFFDRAAVDELRTRLCAHLAAHGTITAQAFKELCGASRKYSIPLAEHFDAEKVTLRVGEIRRRRS